METIDWWDTSHAPAALRNPVTSPSSPLPHTNPIRVSAPQAANRQGNADLASMTLCGGAPCAFVSPTCYFEYCWRLRVGLDLPRPCVIISAGTRLGNQHVDR